MGIGIFILILEIEIFDLLNVNASVLRKLLQSESLQGKNMEFQGSKLQSAEKAPANWRQSVRERRLALSQDVIKFIRKCKKIGKF